jgi:hypothetical protein
MRVQENHGKSADDRQVPPNWQELHVQLTRMHGDRIREMGIITDSTSAIPSGN